jgi:hypothetical protein
MATLKLAWTEERRTLEAFRVEAEAWAELNTRIVPAAQVEKIVEATGKDPVIVDGRIVAFLGEGEPTKPPISYGVYYSVAQPGDATAGLLAGQDSFGSGEGRTYQFVRIVPAWYDFNRPLYGTLSNAVMNAEFGRLERHLGGNPS